VKLSTLWLGALTLTLSTPALARADDPRPPGTPATEGRVEASDPDGGSATGFVNASHRSSRHSRHRSSVRLHLGWGWGGWWGDPWGYYGPRWGYGPGWGYGPSWGYTTVYPNPSMRHGALDLDVSPERAEVWVDGRRIGVADDFDGFPSYLWLEKGTYDVVVYLQGYRTLARQYTIYPGLVIDVEDRLERGEAVHPNDLGPKSHVNRDERLRRDREAEAEALEREREQERWMPPGEEPDEWGPRSRRPDSLDARGEPARVHIEVVPEDASVYLDGRFLGTGRELARLRAGLTIDAGHHTLEVVRPGYEPTRRTIEIEAGAEEEIEVELEARPGG
jgi:hypothetical protein